MKSVRSLSIYLMLGLFSFVNAQTATNFTEDDCDGISHTLFDELDQGKIIVIAWVMPCGSCSYFGSSAYDAVQSFNESHPGIVEFYLTDDYANTSCSNISNWGTSNNMENHTAFSSTAINMSDYGTDGMPKVVVLAGTEHQILYNENNGSITYDGVESAINSALENIGIEENINQPFSLFPNPSRGIYNFEFYNEENTVLEVFSITGEIVSRIDTEACIPNRMNRIQLDLSEEKEGMYIVKYTTSSHQISKLLSLTPSNF